MGSEEPLGASFIGFLAEKVRDMASECFMEVLRGADGGMPVDAFDTDWSVSLYAAPLTDNVGVAVRILLHLVEITEEKRLEVRFA